MKAPGEEIYSKSTICDYLLGYSWLVVTVALLRTVCDIISGVDVENRHFTPLYSDCRPPHGRLQRGKWTQLVSSLAQGGGEFHPQGRGRIARDIWVILMIVL